jgi:hypothetical protein
MQSLNLLLELPSLEQVFDQCPVTVSSDTATIDAVKLMSTEDVSYVLITKNSHLLGILTEQDVVRLISENVALLHAPISRVMQQNVVTLNLWQAQNPLTILTTLQQHQLHQVAIVNEQNQLLGVVSKQKLHQLLQPQHTEIHSQTAIALQQQIDQERLIAEIAQRIRRSLNLPEILQTTVDRVRQFLTCDRVIIFRFEPDWSGNVVVESVDPRWTPILSMHIHDPCFENRYIEPYCQGSISTVANLHASGVEPCYVELLAQFQVQANLVVPILQESYEVSAQESRSTSQLWGLLIAHQCDAPRQWQPLEITLLQQLATQVGIAIQQSELYHQAQAELVERRRAEESLRQNNEWLTLALEAAKMGSWDWDLPTGKIVWTTYHESILGYEPGTLMRTYQDWRDRVHPDDLTRVETSVEIARRDRQDYECEYRVIRPDRTQRWVVGFGRFLYNADGEAIRMVGMIRDITEKKQLEAQFFRAQRLESLGTLASGIAHDLNNVLTPILAAAQYLRLRFPQTDERHQQMLKMLEMNARRGADLVQQVLSFARGVEGRRILLQVEPLVTEIEQIVKRTFPKSIEVHTEILSPKLWMVSADSTQLHQVMMNLCVNARDAMLNGGTLTISAENRVVDSTFAQMHVDAEVGSYVMITISDTGSGIAPELLDRIFDPFFTTKEIGKGTGLGLATVVGILKSHHGFISVSSEVGQGSRFQVYLPAAQGLMEAPPEPPESPQGQGELILVVDDELAVQEIMRAVLEDHHYRTIVASDGYEAIARYAEHQSEIQLVIMDIMMPSMGGLTAIRTLQQLNPNVKIIATSGLIVSSQLSEIREAAVHVFLPKPYNTHDLLTTIRQVLDRS